MKQYPRRQKYRKYHRPGKGYIFLNSTRSCYPLLGTFALKAVKSGKVTYNQIEAGRKIIRRNLKKQGTILIRVFTFSSLTKKPLATRMGSGKGGHAVWVCPIRKGQIIYEVTGVIEDKAIQALSMATCKLSIKTSISKLYF